MIGTMLLPMLLPLLIYGPLFSLPNDNWQHNDDWQHDPSTVMMHVVLTGIMVLCAVGTLLTWFNSLQREYALPITTWKLVATRSIGGALVAAATYALACLTMNWLFQAGWPLQGPVLLTIAVYLVAQAAYLLTMKSQALGLLVFAPLCLAGGWWFVVRYEMGGFDPGGTGQRLQMWLHVTWGEWCTLLTVSVAGVWGSYYAARLQRMGNGPTMAGVVARLFGETPRSGSAALPDFTTDQSALSWREWHERGRAIPWLFVTAALIYGGLWLLLPLSAQEAVAMGGGFSIMGAVSFLAWGIYLGMRSKEQAFPSFDATRPVTDAQWSTALLRNTARSTLTACGVWILGVALVGAIAWGVEGESLTIARGNSLGSELAHFNLAAPYKLAALFAGMAVLIGCWGLACWTFAANGMTLALLQRKTTIVVVPGGFLLVTAMFVTKEWVSEHLGRIVAMSLWNTFLATLLLAALGSFLVAWRRRLIGHSTCFLSLVAWLALTCGVLCWLVWLDTGHFLPERIDLLGCFLVASPLVLPFLPLAATPLAVARNRHRS